MTKIVSRIINRGDKCESDWPPAEPSCKGFTGYWDKESRTVKEGYPPRPQKLAQAPFIIQDTIDPFYHQAACTYVDSRSKLRDVDNACGTITTDKPLPPDPSKQNALNRARKQDIHDSLHKAVAQVDAGTAPLNEEQRAKCAQQNEIVSSALNFDAFNAVGRKTDARGKRFRKRK